MPFLVKHKPQLSANNENLHEMARGHVKVPKDNVNYTFPDNVHISVSHFSS